MVKNTTGGKGSKSLARKNENFSSGGGKLRTADANCVYEQYAIVTSALGNCRFYVTTIIGQKLILKVQGKFSGRNKRNNLVSIGSYILIGLYDFEEPNFKNSSLLELYTDFEVKILASLPSPNSTFFLQSSRQSSQPDDGLIVFSNEDSFKVLQTLEEKQDTEMIDDEINIDDI
jgi:hypothetical protein